MNCSAARMIDTMTDGKIMKELTGQIILFQSISKDLSKKERKPKASYSALICCKGPRCVARVS